MQYLSGYIGNTVIAQQPYVSRIIPEWKGSPAYGPMYYSSLKCSVGVDLYIPNIPELKQSNQPIKHSENEHRELAAQIEKNTNDSENWANKMMKLAEDHKNLKPKLDSSPEDAKISQITTVTSCDVDTALKLLKSCNGSEQAAIQKFFDDRDNNRSRSRYM